MPQNLTNEKSNIDSGNGLVPSGNKPFPEPMWAIGPEIGFYRWNSVVDFLGWADTL